MNMKFACCTAAIALAISTGASAATIINVNGATNGGTTVSLAAGTYEIEFVGQADGGLYDAWHAWSGVNVGCNGAGENCSRGWLIDKLALDLGSAGGFDRTNGFLYTQPAAPGDNHRYSTAAAALAQIDMADFSYTAFGSGTSTSFGGPITFTIGADQDVNFVIQDIPFTDNKGGVSFVLNAVNSAVPEPATWGMMIAGFGIMGAAMRRRTTNVSFA